jgi:purine-binding chemotaxis protein CheW
MTAPDDVLLNESAVLSVQVANSGAVAVARVELHFLLPAALEHPQGDSVAVEVGRLAPGEAAQITLKATAVQTGAHAARVWVTADGAVQGSAQAEVRVVQATLQLALDGPASCRLQQPAEFRFTLANPGTAAAADVRVVCSLPEGAEVVSANPGVEHDRSGQRLVWNQGRLAPGSDAATVVRLRFQLPGDFALRATATAAGGLQAEAAATGRIEDDATAAILDQFLAEVEEEDRAAQRPGSAGRTRGSLDQQHILFTLAGTDYAVPITNVLEIGQPLQVRAVPNVPEWVLGVANVRGDIVSMVDLRRFLGMEADRPVQGRRMMVCRTRTGELTTGLLVDRVRGIRSLPVEARAVPSSRLGDRVTAYLQGMAEYEGRLLLFLDLDRLLLSAEMRQFELV